jgi:aldehyde dehydrogenase (NAD+)
LIRHSAINPATEEVICSVVAGILHILVYNTALPVLELTLVALASPKDIDAAVLAARQAFKTSWGKNVTGFERSRLINKLADLIERDAQELGELETLNNGKPLKIAR